MRTEDGSWHAGNGWGIQVLEVRNVKGKDRVIWRHATDRAMGYSKQMALVFKDGLLLGDSERRCRLVSPSGEIKRYWGRKHELEDDSTETTG